MGMAMSNPDGLDDVAAGTDKLELPGNPKMSVGHHATVFRGFKTPVCSRIGIPINLSPISNNA